MSARSQPVASVLAVIMVATMTSTLLLTFGRSEGARRDVMDALDSAGARTITIRAEPDAGVDTRLLRRLDALRELDLVTGFGPSLDVTNTVFPRGTPVSMRTWFSARAAATHVRPGTGLVSPATAQRLRLADGIGSVHAQDGTSVTVAGMGRLSSSLTSMEPVVLIPQRTRGELPVTLIVMLAHDARQVRALVDTTRSMVVVDDPTKVTIAPSLSLADVGGEITTQMSKTARNLVLVLTIMLGMLLSAILYGLVMLRRKDFGRRRALGASRIWITLLVISQTALTGAIGVLLGGLVGLAFLAIIRDPIPGLKFIGAVAAVTFGLSVVAALSPAWAASRRDPIVELRVP